MPFSQLLQRQCSRTSTLPDAGSRRALQLFHAAVRNRTFPQVYDASLRTSVKHTRFNNSFSNSLHVDRPQGCCRGRRDHCPQLRADVLGERHALPASILDARWRYAGAAGPPCYCTALIICVIGWVIGDLEMDDYYLKILSVELQLVIVHVDYRLAHPRVS